MITEQDNTTTHNRKLILDDITALQNHAKKLNGLNPSFWKPFLSVLMGLLSITAMGLGLALIPATGGLSLFVAVPTSALLVCGAFGIHNIGKPTHYGNSAQKPLAKKLTNLIEATKLKI